MDGKRTNRNSDYLTKKKQGSITFQLRRLTTAKIIFHGGCLFRADSMFPYSEPP